MRRVILSFASFVLILCLVTVILRDDQKKYALKQKARTLRTQIRRHGGYRIAVLIPFVAKSSTEIPPYLDLFCASARGSQALVDFIIFHNGVLRNYTSSAKNVRLIDLQSTKGVAHLLARVTDRRGEDMMMKTQDILVSIIQKHVENYPYVLVEFKPALGHIFQEYIQGYTHWAYSDLDIAFGDLPRWITKEELSQFDIVTYGFGDQDRIYLRGQFTIHKNSPQHINQLWRGCDYLSELDRRFATVLSGKAKLRFESAEGCYSTAILKDNTIKVKYAVKAFTDVHENDSLHKEGLYIGIGKHKDKSVIYKAGQDGKALVEMSPTWFETKGNAYSSRNGTKALQWEIGERTSLETVKDRNKKCMYWVQEKYQSSLCLDDVSRSDTLFLIEGQLYKQKHKNAELPGGILSAPFFHFQEWKRYYRYSQLTPIDRSAGALTWVLIKEGAIPVSHVQGKGSLSSPLNLKMPRWNAHRKQLPHSTYCLIAGPKRFPPVPPAPGCELLTSWQDYDAVQILSTAPAWKQVNVTSEVTLVMTLQITANQAKDASNVDKIIDIALANIIAWQGQPSILLVYLAGATPRSIDMVRDHFVDINNDACMVAMIVQTRSGYVSRKALMNMAQDIAPSRWIVTGIELERGMIMSKEAAMFCHRRARIQDDAIGQVLIVPQVAIGDAEGKLLYELSILSLLKMKRDGKPGIFDPLEFEKGACTEDFIGSNSIFTDVDDLWWEMTAVELTRNRTAEEDEEYLERLAGSLRKLEESFVRLLTNERHYHLFAIDMSPILMVDNMGPYGGIKTSDVAREVEELGGKQCYNSLRLAQLVTMGYSVHLVPGAFAFSSHHSRLAALNQMNKDTFGASRCDGCFMFDEEHEEILEAITLDERVRPAKAAVLWNEVYQSKTSKN